VNKIRERLARLRWRLHLHCQFVGAPHRLYGIALSLDDAHYWLDVL
jgi:hypothetical protein